MLGDPVHAVMRLAAAPHRGKLRELTMKIYDLGLIILAAAAVAGLVALGITLNVA